MRAGETQDLPDTLPATDSEVEGVLNGNGKKEKHAKPGKNRQKMKGSKGKKTKNKAKKEKAKKSKKTHSAKKGVRKSKSSGVKKSHLKKEKEHAKKDLRKEFEKVASTESVPATQPEKNAMAKEEGVHRPHASLVGYVYYSAKDQWQLKLQELMVGEDYKQCIVEAGGYILFFEDENCVLSHLPDRTQFQLRVFREPVQAQAYAQIRASEKQKMEAREKEQKAENEQKQAEALAKKAADAEIKQMVAEELAQIEHDAAETAEKLARQKAAAKKEQEEKIAQQVAKAIAEQKQAEEEEEKARAEKKKAEEEKIAIETAKMLAKQRADEEAKEASKKAEEEEKAAKLAELLKVENEKAVAAEKEKEEAARVAAEEKRIQEEKIALQVATALAEQQQFSDDKQKEERILELVQKAKKMLVQPEVSEQEQRKEREKRAVESNLLRPSTMDLCTPPSTPMPADATLPESVAGDPLPPGQEEAEKLKAAALERQKKRNAQWGRFMRTFASGGPISCKKDPISQFQTSYCN
jgi:hypothetical protein